MKTLWREMRWWWSPSYDDTSSYLFKKMESTHLLIQKNSPLFKNGSHFSDQKMHMHLPKCSTEITMHDEYFWHICLAERNLFFKMVKNVVLTSSQISCSLLLPSAQNISAVIFATSSTSQMSHWEFVYWQYKTDGILSAR